MAAVKSLDTLGQDIVREADRYHVPAQIGRFAFLFGSALAVQTGAGAPLLGWTDLRALVVAAAGVAWRQWAKTVPLSSVLGAVKAAAPQGDNASVR